MGKDQYDLFGGEPPHQRHSDTSRAAAVDIEDDVNRLQMLVFAELKRANAIDEELIDRTGLAANTLRPRRVELVQKGWVRDSGRRRLTRARRWAVVWEITPEEST